MPTPNLNDLLNNFQSDVDLVHQFVKGDATVTVVGANGSYPSLAKIAADAIASLNTVNTDIATSKALFDSVVAAAQASIATMIANGNTSITDLVSASQTAINNFLASSQAELSASLAASQTAINSFIAAGNVEINNVVSQLQQALAVNNAALIAAENALANAARQLQGLVGRSFQFASSMSWHIIHNMNSQNFKVSITNTNGDTVYAKIRPINLNEFAIDFNEPEAGVIFVDFYL